MNKNSNTTPTLTFRLVYVIRCDLAHYAYDPSPPCVQVLHLQPSAIMPDGGPGSWTLLQDPKLSFRRGYPVPAWVHGQLKHLPQHQTYPPPTIDDYTFASGYSSP